VSDLLDFLIGQQYKAATGKRTEMLEAFNQLRPLVFILLIDLISVKAEASERYVRTKWLHTYSEVRVVRKDDEEPLFEQLKKYDRLRHVHSSNTR
jgi:hypothetical protein